MTDMTTVNDERINAHLDGIDAAADWTPESTYDPRPFRLWWHGLMTWDEYQAHRAKVAAIRAAYMERMNEHVERLMAEWNGEYHVQ